MAQLSRRSRTRLRLRSRQNEVEGRAAIAPVAGGVPQHRRAVDRAVQAAVAEVARIAQNGTHPAHTTPGGTERELVPEPSIDREQVSAYLAVQAETMAAVLKQAYLLMHEEKLSRDGVLLPLLRAIAGAGEPLLAVVLSREHTATVAPLR